MYNSDFFRYSPHESEDSAVASDEEEDDQETEEEEDDDESGNEGYSSQKSHKNRGDRTGGYTEMKEQIYQDKLHHLKSQLEELQNGSLPEYTKKLKRLEGTYRERMRICAVIRDLETDMIEQDFLNEKRSAAREFEEQKVFLRDQLIHELEEKQRMIEAERHNMELTGDTMDIKPISKRQLRRRVHDTGASAGASGYGGGGKRRGGGNGTNGGNGKPVSLVSINFLLDDSDVHEDLKIINKNNRSFGPGGKAQGQGGSGSAGGPGGSGASGSEGPGGGLGGCGNASSASTSSSGAPGGSSYNHRDTRIEEGKLFYEKRWFGRGQSVQVESKTEKFPAMISAIGTEDIQVRKATDNTKLRIYLTWLQKGKYLLRRRAA